MLAATTHILKGSYLRDIPEIEFLCMGAAKCCDIDVAAASLLPFDGNVLAVECFDREVFDDGPGSLRVHRLHEEDFAQALGVLPASKYAQLPEGTVRAVASLLRTSAVRPAVAGASFAGSSRSATSSEIAMRT
ncbi:MAG: HipA domain-containing protein [Coriobacteriales bacterium]|jgi:serine/threonine-protein kinase HipA